MRLHLNFQFIDLPLKRILRLKRFNHAHRLRQFPGNRRHVSRRARPAMKDGDPKRPLTVESDSRFHCTWDDAP